MTTEGKKISSRTLNSTPVLTDYLLGNKASIPDTQRFLLSDLLTLIIANVPQGWQDISSVATLTYSSWDSTNATGVMSSDTDLTPIISVGMKMQITQSSTVKYFFVTAITSTTVTGYFGTDYTLTSATISSPYYSALKAPYGFPLDPSKWTQSYAITTDHSTTSATYAQCGTDQLTLPIGSWHFSGKYLAQIALSGNNGATFYTGFSTSTNSVSDVELIHRDASPAITSLTGTVSDNIFVRKTITVASATVYYLIFRRGTALTCTIVGNTDGNGFIKAVCAYL